VTKLHDLLYGVCSCKSEVKTIMLTHSKNKNVRVICRGIMSLKRVVNIEVTW
jgi:hypothetical protein